MPIGEFASGFVMGGLIPLASYLALTGKLEPLTLIWALPTIIGVGLIMMTNNTSDIERDIPAGRHTLPILLGRESARTVYHGALVVWIVLIVLNDLLFFRTGIIIMPFMILAAYPLLKALWANPLTPERRLQSMPQILSVNIVLGAFYGASILMSGFSLVAF